MFELKIGYKILFGKDTVCKITGFKVVFDYSRKVQTFVLTECNGMPDMVDAETVRQFVLRRDDVKIIE